MPSAAAWLEISDPSGTRRFPLTPGATCRIGRRESSSIVVTDDLASRSHALIQSLEVGAWTVTDLGSVNGTHVSGRRITVPTVLKTGDEISIGRTTIRFCQEGPDIPAQEQVSVSEIEATNVYRAEKLITVLVVDIRNYTVLAQKLGADALSQVVRHLFSEAGKTLHASGSWAQKYIGDAIMSVWIHDRPDVLPGEEIARAVQALAKICEIAAQLQPLFSLTEPIRIGAGINSGSASVGNVGSIAAADYTAVGDVVNKAFRLESATKQAGADLLIGQETREHLAGYPRLISLLRPVQVDLKGYDQPVAAWGMSFEALLTSRLTESA